MNSFINDNLPLFNLTGFLLNIKHGEFMEEGYNTEKLEPAGFDEIPFEVQ